MADSQQAERDEVAWYARHAPSVRAAQALLLELAGEVGGALTTAWVVRFRDALHYTAVKWVLEDRDLLPTLRRLRDELLADVDAEREGRLAALRRATCECLDFASAALPNRANYEEVRRVEAFRHRLQAVAGALGAIRAAVEAAVLPDPCSR